MSQILRRIATKMQQIPPVVSTHFLNEQMKKPDFTQNFRIIDATWDLPSACRDPEKEHIENRIPSAKFFDIDGCSTRNTDLPHMLPSKEQFQEYVSSLGVGNGHHVIIYDNSPKFGLFSAPRVWWTFRTFGHDAVSVLNGGLPKWITDGFPIESGIPSEQQEKLANFIAKFRPELVHNLHFIKDNIKNGNKTQTVDARPSGRFHGTSPEPRADIPSGHMPGSFNVPFMDCLSENRELKSPEELTKLFEKFGVNIDKEIVASCGSGVSACIFALSVYVCNGKEVPVFDGSWVEFATKEPSLILRD